MNQSQSITIPIPEGFNFEQAFANALEKALEPVGRMEMLKRRDSLTPEEVCFLYGTPVSTLATLRTRGGGPEYQQAYKHGPVTYTHDAMRVWLGRIKMKT